MEKRYFGIDLHRNRFTCCIRLENERTYLTEWALERLEKFVKKLRPSDELAVEITSNTRLFYDAVAPHVGRVVVVDSNQFRVISRSVKKTDSNDARLLSLYLSKGLLPEVRMKDKELGQLASLTQTRDTLVKQRSALKNKVNNILSARGLNLAKEALSSEKKLSEVLELPFDEIVRIELRVSGVNYFFRSTTTISPYRRQLQAFAKLISPLHWCWPEQRIRLCRDAP